MVLGVKWKLRIAFFLLRAPRRNGELTRLLPTISQQDAHPAARELAADGIAVRTVHEQVPPRVDYAVAESERRGLLITSTETDVADIGIPTMINLYSYDRGDGSYPMITSADDADGNPIPWVALSGMAGDPTDPSTVYAVSDAFLADGFVHAVDVGTEPAVITRRTQVTGASAALDLEGIAVGPDGSWWLGSEGDDDSRPNLVLRVDPATGTVLDELELPAGLVDQARSNGIEGIAVTGSAGAETVYVAIQRAWPDEGDIDEVETKIGRYDLATGTWGFVHYPLEPEAGGDWIGLSELTLLPDGTFAVVERDKGWGRAPASTPSSKPSTGSTSQVPSSARSTIPPVS